MAKGDIVAKLILNSKDFDGKIAKSKKEVSSMKNLGKEVFGGMTSALKGYAVAAGAAVTVSEAFKAFIGSSQGLTDAWGRSLEATKTVFENFMYSVGSADFSSFDAGITSMIQKAREAYDAMDQLANTKMSANFVTQLDQTRYREAMVRARDKSLSFEERQAALNEAKRYAANVSQAAMKVNVDSEAALKARFAKVGNFDARYISSSMIEQAFRVDARTTSSQEREALTREYEAYLSAIDGAKERAQRESEDFQRKLPFAYKGSKQFAQNVRQVEEFRDEREAQYIADVQNRFSGSVVKYIALMRLSDEQLQESMELYLAANAARNTASEMNTSTNELQTTINNERLNASKRAATAPAQKTRPTPRLAGLPGMPAQTVDKASLIAPTLSEEKQYQLWHDTRPAGWADAVFFEQEMKAMKEAQGEAEQLTNVFNTLGDAIGGSAGNMLNFAGSLTDAVAAMVPFLSYLQAEAIQHDVNANAAMKQAAANTLAAYSGIPFAGLALGAAAVASIVGVMKSLPMLANGGVVTGPTVAMIGEAGKEAVLPLDRLKEFVDVSPREIHVTGEIRAQGKDLVVAIDNYNKVRRVK